MSTQLGQIALKAKWDQKARLTSLAHLLTPEFLKETWGKMNRKAASGIDGESCEQFESELDRRVQELCEQLRAGTCRAPPVRRVEIPKGPGKTGTRPLGIPTVADRLPQRAVARILEAVFEADFLDCSYGFRPGRSPHHALRALRTRIVTGKVRHVAEADIRGYFTHISHHWLRQMVAHRIADPVVLRLIGKWLRAGVMHEGVVLRTEEGTPQGGPITPWTQKRTSTLSAGSPGGGASRWLTLDVKSIILTSHGAIHASAKGAEVERGLSTTLTGDERGGGGRDAGARTRDLTASRISISRGSRTTQAAYRGCRASTSHYVQDLRHRHPRAARVCGGHQLDAERGCNTRHHGVRGACAPTWLRDCANAVSASNTPSIVSSPSSSNRSTSFSSPIMCG